MGLPDVGLGGHSREGGHLGRGHEEELAPPYRGQRVVLGPPPGGPTGGANNRANGGATSGGHELGHAEGANVGEAEGATIRLDDGPPRDGGHDGGHSELPDAGLEGEQMSFGERLAVAFRYWMVQAFGSAKTRIKSPGSLYHTQPESLAQYHDRVDRHAWVPEGYEGKWLANLGVAYHQSFGNFGTVTGYAWKWLWTTPLAFFPALAFVFVLVILIKFT